MANYYKTGRTLPYFAAGVSTGTVAGHTVPPSGNSDGFQGEAHLSGCSFFWDSGVGNVGGANTWISHGRIEVNQGFGAHPLLFPSTGSYTDGTDSQTVADPANFTATMSWDVTGTVEETIGFPDTITGGSPDTNLAIYHQFALGSVLTCRLSFGGSILIVTGTVTQPIPFGNLTGAIAGDFYNPYGVVLYLHIDCSDGSLPRGTADTAAGTNYITSFPYLMKVQTANGGLLTDYSVPSDPNYIAGAHGYNVRTYKLGNQYRTEADISVTSSGVAGDGRYPKNYGVGTGPTFGTLRSYTVNSWLERDDKQYDNPVPMYVSATDPNVSTSVKQAVYVAIKGFGSADYTQYGYTSCGLPKSFNPPQDFSSILTPIVVATDTGSGGVWGDFNNKPTVQQLCGWKWNAINLTQAASADVDTAPSTTNWSVVPAAVGSVTLSNSGGLRIVTGAAITNIGWNSPTPPAIYSPLTQASLSVYNASQPDYFSFAGYRWLRIYVSTPAASAKMSVFLQITPHRLFTNYDDSGVYMQWDTIVTSGYIDIDLMCPTNALNVWEEGHGGVIGQTFQGYPDSSYSQLQGVDRVYSASLQTENRQYGFQLRFDPNTTYTLSSLQLITQDHRVVDFNPDRVDPQTDTDGKGMQLPSQTTQQRGNNVLDIAHFAVEANGIFQSGSGTIYTQPTNGLTAIPLNVMGDSAHVFNGLINATLPAAWLWGAGYIPTLNQWGFGASLDSTQGNSGIQPAQFMFTKLATFPPDCGDIFGMDQNGTIPISLPPLQLRSASVMRVQYKGVVHTPLSLPSVGTTVTVTRLSDGAIMGSGVTDKWGYYTADTSGFDLLLSATLSDHLVVVSAGSVSTPHGNTAIHGDKNIRRQWVHFKGVNSGSGPPGGGTPPGGGIPPGGGVIPGNSNFGTNPFCFQDQWGRLHQTMVVKGAPTFYRSDFATPGKNLTWAVTGVTISPAAAVVAPNKGDQFPRSIMDYRGVTTCVWQRNGDTMSSRSHDDGATWEGAIMAIPGGTYPTIAVGIDGTVIEAALVANADQVGSPGGVIKMRCQSPGAVAYGALYTAQYYSSGLLPIPVAVDSFHLQQGYESASRWVLHCHVQGETGTADYFSSDLDASSWSRLT